MNILGEKLPESAHYYPHLLPIDLQREYNGTDETQSSWRGGWERQCLKPGGGHDSRPHAFAFRGARITRCVT